MIANIACVAGVRVFQHSLCQCQARCSSVSCVVVVSSSSSSSSSSLTTSFSSGKCCIVVRGLETRRRTPISGQCVAPLLQHRCCFYNSGRASSVLFAVCVGGRRERARFRSAPLCVAVNRHRNDSRALGDSVSIIIYSCLVVTLIKIDFASLLNEIC